MYPEIPRGRSPSAESLQLLCMPSTHISFLLLAMDTILLADWFHEEIWRPMNDGHELGGTNMKNCEPFWCENHIFDPVLTLDMWFSRSSSISLQELAMGSSASHVFLLPGRMVKPEQNYGHFLGHIFCRMISPAGDHRPKTSLNRFGPLWTCRPSCSHPDGYRDQPWQLYHQPNKNITKKESIDRNDAYGLIFACLCCQQTYYIDSNRFQ